MRRARTALSEFGQDRADLLLPASRDWGFDRGTPIDRLFIEDFLRQRSVDVEGRVLEFGGAEYTRLFRRGGGAGGVTHVDVIDLDPSNGEATIIGDLVDPDVLQAGSFDCVICTEVLMLIYDVKTAIANLHRALRPGGVLLVTVAGISQICRPERDAHGDFWRFTSLSLRRVLEEVFPSDQIEIQGYGNVRAATAFLYGLAAEELSEAELRYRDKDFEVTIAARAKKPG
jgi:SAM-dependent methyltransferase